MGEKTTGKKKISIRNRFRSFRGYKEKVSGTPYDDAFRTLLVKCPSLLIPMVNEAFGTHYIGTEKVVLFQNEHFVHQINGSPRKRITDSSFSIKAGSPCIAVSPTAEPDAEVPKYIMECQTNSDGAFLIRLFEYAIETGLESSTLTKGKLVVTIPKLAVLFLRKTCATPDSMEIQIKGYGNTGVSIGVPVLMMSDYTLDDLFRKKLYFLLPFFLFTRESILDECEKDEKKLAVLLDEYRSLSVRLNNAVNTGGLSTYDFCIITDLLKLISDNVAIKYINVRKGVKAVMGGNVIETPSSIAYDAGMKKGMKKGEKIGKKIGKEIGKEIGLLKGKREAYYQMIQDGDISVARAAQKLGLTEQKVRDSMLLHGFSIPAASDS